MATQAPTKPTQGKPAQAAGISKAELERITREVMNAPASEKSKAVVKVFREDEMVAKLERLLPANMRGQGARLIDRAILTMNRKPKDYEQVELVSIVRAVLEAAEVGLAIDGKLAHAVVYANSYKENGEWKKKHEAQLQIDYKGMIAVAKRGGQVLDCYAENVYAADVFQMRNVNGTWQVTHEPCLHSARGEFRGTYAFVEFPDGSKRPIWMNVDEINAIRSRSKSYMHTDYNTKQHDPKGPWVTDYGEMAKKTAIKRHLKTIIDDPGFQRVAEIDDRDYDEEGAADRIAAYAPPRSGRAIAEAIHNAAGNGNGTTPTADVTPEPEAPEQPLAEGEVPNEAEATEAGAQAEAAAEKPPGVAIMQEAEAQDVEDNLSDQFEKAQSVVELNAAGAAWVEVRDRLPEKTNNRLDVRYRSASKRVTPKKGK